MCCVIFGQAKEPVLPQQENREGTDSSISAISKYCQKDVITSKQNFDYTANDKYKTNA